MGTSSGPGGQGAGNRPTSRSGNAAVRSRLIGGNGLASALSLSSSSRQLLALPRLGRLSESTARDHRLGFTHRRGGRRAFAGGRTGPHNRNASGDIVAGSHDACLLTGWAGTGFTKQTVVAGPRHSVGDAGL
jgi:hypothetical protein